MTRPGASPVAAGGSVVAAMLMIGTAAAHLTGVFAYFMQDLDHPTAGTRMLQQQISSVQARIDKLTPEVSRAREEYYSRVDGAVPRMKFYDVYSGSALGALWAGAQNPIDVIASTEQLKSLVRKDLAELTDLATLYQRLQGTEQSLRRYADVLVPFRTASQAREARLAKAPRNLISPYAEPYVAYRISEDWETLRATTFVLYFTWAARQIAERGMEQVLEKEPTGSGWQLQEEVLNALVGGDAFPFIHQARFFLRADHVIFSAQMDSARDHYQLLTVGQLERTSSTAVQYRIEAIFLDGMPLDPDDPDIQREVYRGKLMSIDVQPLAPKSKPVATFEQRNGSVLFRFR
jgi:hypothetical protein